MKVIECALTSIAILVSASTTANSAELHIQFDKKTQIDAALSEALNKSLIESLDKKYPKNTFVVIVNYDISYTEKVCAYTISMTGGYKDKNNRILIDKALSPADIALGLTQTQTGILCVKALADTSIEMGQNVYMQYNILNKALSL